MVNQQQIDARKNIQKKLDVSHAEAERQNRAQQRKIEAANANFRYVTNPNNLGSGSTNIDLTSPAGRALYKAYQDSGVVLDDDNNVLYNPADLGSYEIEQYRARSGQSPSFEQRGEPSIQYQSALRAAGVSEYQIQNILKERRNLANISTKNRAEIAALGEQKKQAQEQIRDIERQQAELNATIPKKRAIGVWKGGYIYNYAEQDAARQDISKRIDALSRDKLNAQVGIQNIEARQAALGVNIQNIAQAQRSLIAKATEVSVANQKPIAVSDRPTILRNQPDSAYANPNFVPKENMQPRPPMPVDIRKERPKALSGQPDSIYANPSFIPKEAMRTDEKFQPFGAQPTGANYNVVLGKPNQPPQYTQEQVNSLSEAEYASYVSQVNAYNAWVREQRKETAKKNLDNILGIKSSLKEFKAQGFTLIDIKTGDKKQTVPLEFAYKSIVAAPVGSTFGVSRTDPLLVKQRQEMIESRKAQKQFIKEAKESGAGFVSIKSADGTQVVPIDFAYKAVAKAPADAVISTKIPVEGTGVGPSKETMDILEYEKGRREISQDPISQLTYASEKQKTKTILPGVLGDVEREYGTQVLSLGAAITNIAENVDVGITRGVGTLFGTKKDKLAEFPDPTTQAYVAPSYEQAYLEAAGKGIKESTKMTDIGFGIKVPLPTLQTFGIAGKSLEQYEKTQTPAKLFAQKTFALAQFAGPEIIPLRQVRIATALETRVPTIIGAPKITSKVEQVARGIKVGYSPEVTKLELVKIKEGPIKAGIPTPASIPQLERVRGLPGRGGYPITEDVSGYMTRKPTLEYLVKKDILKTDEAEILAKTKPYLSKSGQYTDDVIRTELPDQPILSLEKGAETTAAFAKLEKESFKTRGTLGSLFGSITEQFYVLPKYLERSRDIDLHPSGKKAVPESQRISREFAQGIQDVARPERQLAVKESWGKILDKFTGKPTGKTELERVTISVGKSKDVKPKRKIIEGEEFDTKVSEFIVKPMDDRGGLYGNKALDPNKVMGFDVPSKEVTVKNVKIGEYKGKQKIQTLRRQELRRVSAGFEMQFEKGPGGSLRADPGREKEYAKIYAIAKTREAQALKAGNIEDAKTFSDYAEDVKAFAEKRGIWKTGEYVSEIDDSGAIVKTPLRERATSSAISSAKDVTQKPIIPISIATPRSEPFVESRSESPRPPSTTSRSETSLLLKYSIPSEIKPNISNLSRIKSQTPSKTRSSIKSTNASSDSPSRVSGISPGVSSTRSSTIPSQRPSVLPSRASGYSRTPSSTPSRVPSVVPSKIPSLVPSKVPSVLPIKDIPQFPKKVVRIPVIPFIKTRQDKTKKNLPRGREDFFGSSHITSIEGFRTKKKDFDYGDIKTARLAQKDILGTNKFRSKFVRNKKSSVIPKTKKPIIAKWDAKKRGEFGTKKTKFF